MQTIKIGMRTMNIPQKIEYARHIVSKMTGNSNFETPNPDLASVTAAIDALETAYTNALDGGKTLKLIQRESEKEFHRLIGQLALYVDNVAYGDREVGASSGFLLRKIPSPIGPMPKPENLRVRTNGKTGTLVGDWESIRGARVYKVQYTPDISDPSQWQYVEDSTKSKIEMEGLESGKMYWMRVAAVNSAGQGPWSEASSSRAT